MSNILLSLITIAFIVAVGVFIYVMIELRSATKALKSCIATAECFTRTTESSLKSTLEELQQTLRSVRNVTDNITDVTEDVKALSSSVRDIGDNVRHASELIEGVRSATQVRVSGLKAGISAALEVLLKNLFLRRKD